MYPSTAPEGSCRPESYDAVQDLARRLRLEAEAVESVRDRLRGAETIGWESPAGRNFRRYAGERSVTVATTAAYLREAASSLDTYGVALAAVHGDGVFAR